VNTHVHVRGRGLRFAALAASLVMTMTVLAAATPVVSSGHAQSTGGSETAPESSAAPSGSAASEPRVVKVERVRPARRKVVRRRFRPWGRPSPRRVRQIIRLEARRWHISAGRLARRVSCESEFRWSAGNGAYQGLLQFASGTFNRGLRTIRSRRVRFVRKGARRVYGKEVIHYSDGHVERKRDRRYRQRVVRVYSGTLPRRPGLTHGWAQLRIGAQAIRGISGVHSSEWGCPA
jgi:hypothetical protein